MASCVGSSKSAQYCAECGVALRADAHECWLCGHSVRVGQSRRASWFLEDHDVGRQFQLDSLFLTTGLLCACLALARVAPRETLVLLVVVSVAYFRTALRVRQWARQRLRVGVWRKVGWFATSSVIVTAIASAGITAAILVTGLGMGIGWLVEWWKEEELASVLWFVLGLASGLFVGIAATVWAAIRLWMWPDPPTELEEACVLAGAPGRLDVH